MDTRSRTPFTPHLENFRQTMVDTPVSRNRLSVLKLYGGTAAEFYKETRYQLFGSTSVSFEFHRWVLIWEDPHRQLLLRLGVVLVYTQVSSPVMMSQAREDLPPSNFLRCGYTSPSYPASALHSDNGAPNGHNVSLCQGSCEDCEWDFPMKTS